MQDDEHEDIIENEFERARSVTSTVATSNELSQVYMQFFIIIFLMNEFNEF